VEDNLRTTASSRKVMQQRDVKRPKEEILYYLLKEVIE
jgi:hypothetical protein